MKTFKEYFESVLMEVPLPPDWDSSVYSPETSFSKQVKYAMERAKRLGSGSSRVVFTIEYEGRQTALKIAKNKKGLAQNQREADYGLYQMYPDITVPLIDYDEENYPPRWIHTEKAAKLTKTNFKQLTGMNFDSFGRMLINDENRRKGKPYKMFVEDEERIQIEESELYYSVTDLMGNFDILAGDLTRLANWGVYRNKPVIIDLGFSSEVQREYY